MSAAEFQHITKTFGDFTAVADLNLAIPEGKLTTLLGPSGCGKTTSLRMLAGYLAPTSGAIRIHGQDATRTPPEKRRLGMVFQTYALFPHMTVLDNVGFGLKVRRVPTRKRRERALAALEMVGLAHEAPKKPKQLSGGQQQRIALARAIAIEPELLLLDEPLSNLDARLRIQMRSEIRRIQAETQLSVVLVTHDQDEALEMSDEMVVMRDGRIQQQGSPEEVFPRPENRFVAEFLGYENFFTLANGAAATIRPEHLHMSLGDVPAGGITFSALVRDIAYRGVDVLFTLDAQDPSGQQVELIVDQRATSALPLNSGDEVTIHAADHHVITLHDK